MKKIILSAFLLCLTASLFAQDAQQETTEVKGVHPYKYTEGEPVAAENAHWSIIPMIGFNVFDGDFHSEMKHPVGLPSAGLGVQYSFTPVWALGAEYLFGMYKVTGDTREPENAATLLKGMMHRADLYVSMDFMNLFFPKAKRKIFSAQLLAGGGYGWYKNSIMYPDSTRGHTGSRPSSSMDNYGGALFLMTGLNLEFNLNRSLALGVRGTYNYFIKDDVDGRGTANVASKNNDGIADIMLNMRIKLEAVRKSHVSNIGGNGAYLEPKPEPVIVHDTVIFHRDSIIEREIHEYFEQKSAQTFYVYFDNGKSTVNEEGLVTIQQVAERMAEDTTLYAVVIGYCDNTGSNKYNYILGDKRAESVTDELHSEHGIANDHLYASGIGKVKGRRSTASYGPNRRAAIKLVDKETFEMLKEQMEDKKVTREEEVKTLPLSETARREKINAYKERQSEEALVEKSTTLAKLARKYYDNTYCWIYIYLANKDRLSNPNALPVGASLNIPELTEQERQIGKDESLALYQMARSLK